jgi:hypothetical protein
MNRMLTMFAAAGALAAVAAPAQAADMSLTRLDCGTPQAPIAVNQRFSDTYAYGDLKLQFVYSCYLVKHGDDYLLWDTGHAMTTPNVAPKVNIVDQLAKLNFSVSSTAALVDASVLAGGDAATAAALSRDGLHAAARVEFQRAEDFTVANGPIDIVATVERFATDPGASSAYTADVRQLDGRTGATPILGKPCDAVRRRV